jgi:hypothetical protein
MMRGLLLIAVAFASGPATGQTFECRAGQDAACLDWGETACTGGGKRVSKTPLALNPASAILGALPASPTWSSVLKLTTGLSKTATPLFVPTKPFNMNRSGFPEGSNF